MFNSSIGGLIAIVVLLILAGAGFIWFMLTLYRRKLLHYLAEPSPSPERLDFEEGRTPLRAAGSAPPRESPPQNIQLHTQRARLPTPRPYLTVSPSQSTISLTSLVSSPPQSPALPSPMPRALPKAFTTSLAPGNPFVPVPPEARRTPRVSRFTESVEDLGTIETEVAEFVNPAPRRPPPPPLPIRAPQPLRPSLLLSAHLPLFPEPSSPQANPRTPAL